KTADRSVVAGSFGEDSGDGLSGQLFCLDLRRGELAQLGLLLLCSGGVDALIGRVAVLLREFAIEFTGIFAGASGHFGSEQSRNEAVFVGGPDLRVAAEKGRSGRLLPHKA